MPNSEQRLRVEKVLPAVEHAQPFRQADSLGSESVSHDHAWGNDLSVHYARLRTESVCELW